MSIGPMGVISSTAGAPLAQSQGTEVSRAQQDTASQARQTQMSEKAEQASGVGHTEQDEQTGDRDADGRRPWEIGPRAPSDSAPADEVASDVRPGHAKDPTGLAGSQLDLEG